MGCDDNARRAKTDAELLKGEVSKMSAGTGGGFRGGVGGGGGGGGRGGGGWGGGQGRIVLRWGCRPSLGRKTCTYLWRVGDSA